MNIPNSILILAAAKLRADEESKKAEALSGKDGAPTLPYLSVGGPLAPTLAIPQFQVGTAVRDIFSGWGGVVVEGPQGEFGELVFIKSNTDGLTYPVRSAQIERVTTSVAPMSAPSPAPEVPAAPAEGAPAKEEATKETKPKVGASFMVSDFGDPRKITYKALLEKVKPTISAAQLIKEFGYVPANFDRLVANLISDGVMVLRSNAKTNVRAMLVKGMNSREILLEACSAGGAVRSSTLRRIEAARAGMAVANRIKAARAENRAKVAGGKPTSPMPTQDPGAGMIYAWNPDTNEWYITTVSASKKVKASYKENDTLLRDGKPYATVYNVSPNWVALMLETGDKLKVLPGDLAEDIEAGTITVEPYKPAGKVKAASGREALPDMPEMDEIVKEGVTEAIDEVASKFESEPRVDAIEHKSRDGFMAFTEGGYLGDFMTNLGYLSGTGVGIGDAETQAKLDGFIAQTYESALESFKEAHADEIKDIPEDKLNYHDLYELGKGDLAERLSEIESDAQNDWSIVGSIGVNYFAPDNTRNQSKKPEFYVYAVVNWETPYHRSGSAFRQNTGHSMETEKVIFEEDIVAETPEQLKAALTAALAKAKAAF
jgi:hypothetical protein